MREALTRLAGEWPTYGYRRLTALLRREGWAVNGKRVRRVMADLGLSEYLDYADALRQLGRFLDAVYNHKRIHSALGYLTPAEFERRWRSRQPA